MTSLRDATNDPPAARARARRARFAAPDWLSAPGKAAFRRLVLDLDATFPDAAGRVDIQTLALMAELLAIAQEAARSMRATGNRPLILEPDLAHANTRRKTPAWQIFREAVAGYLSIAREYGLTFAARQRLELDVPAGADLEDDEDDLELAL